MYALILLSACMYVLGQHAVKQVNYIVRTDSV
jgi:hypothetical protein